MVQPYPLDNTTYSYPLTSFLTLQALAIARQQGAKALELRAAMSLSRLWQAQGQPDAARTLLADVYSGFTEGFDTADLQAAKSLLEMLEGTDLR
jgi:predicted ATPase